jgi:hypothetical protein
MVSERDFRVACLFSSNNDAALNIRSLKINLPMVKFLQNLNFRDRKDSLTAKVLASFVTDSSPSSSSVHFNTNSTIRPDKSPIFISGGKLELSSLRSQMIGMLGLEDWGGGSMVAWDAWGDGLLGY